MSRGRSTNTFKNKLLLLFRTSPKSHLDAQAVEHAKATTVFRFLDLPAELRNRVYELVTRIGPERLENEYPKPSYKKDCPKIPPLTKVYPKTPNITKVCRQIRQEALPMFYNNQEFIIDLRRELSISNFNLWLRSLYDLKIMGKELDVAALPHRFKCVTSFSCNSNDVIPHRPGACGGDDSFIMDLDKNAEGIKVYVATRHLPPYTYSDRWDVPGQTFHTTLQNQMSEWGKETEGYLSKEVNGLQQKRADGTLTATDHIVFIDSLLRRFCSVSSSIPLGKIG